MNQPGFLDRYTQFGPVFALHQATHNNAWMCEDCGAVVVDTRRHDRFHTALSEHLAAGDQS